MKFRCAEPQPGAALVQFGAREGDHEERVVARPLEQVLDEVEQARVRPLEILEGEHHRVRVGQSLEEEPPGREELLAVAGDAVLEAQEMREPRLDEGALRRIEQVLVHRRRELLAGRLRRLVLADQAAHAHHVRERPVGDALAVGEAAPAVPPDGVDDAVEVLVELPGEARLADAGDSGDGHQVGAAVVRRRVEEVLDQLELAVAADERGLEPGRLEGARPRGDHPERAEQRDLLRLALELVRACLLVGDRLLAWPGGSTRPRAPCRARPPTGRARPC